jgi:uncharacterized membrane protein (UPF0127 family)
VAAGGRSLTLTIGALAVVALAIALSLVASGAGCEKEADSPVHTIRINGRPFHLELALDNTTRFKGLSDRTQIEPDGGMLFVFPRPANQAFVMRDCPIAIDIIFLDGSGRIVAFHEMVPEEPRGATESQSAYDARLRRYPSRFDAQFVIELAGGTIDTLNLAEGQQVELGDLNALKRRAR